MSAGIIAAHYVASAGSGPIVQSKAGDSGLTDDASFSVTLDAAAASGNYVIVAITAGATVATPAGWSLARSQVNFNAAYIFYRQVGAGESSWTFTPSSTIQGAWVAMEVSGLAATPLDKVVSVGWTTSGTATRSTGTTATTAQANELLVAAFASNLSAGATGTWGSHTNSFTEIGETCTPKASGVNALQSLAYKTVSATGAYECSATTTTPSPGTAILVTFKLA